MENIFGCSNFSHVKLSVANVLDNVAYGCFCNGILQELLFDLLNSVDDGGVVSAAEFLADLYHGHLCDLTNDVHGDLACEGNVCVALTGFDIIRRYAVCACNFFYDLADGDRCRLIVVYNIADGALCGINGGCGALYQMNSLQLLYGTFQLADIALQLHGDELADTIRNMDTDELGLSFDNSPPGMPVGL